MGQQRTFLRLGSMFEIMETRSLMAADTLVDSVPVANVNNGPVYLKVTEETRASDVNDDGVINHHDAHAVLSFLSARSQPTQLVEGEADVPKVDINGDGDVGPMDVLWIVNQIKQYDPLTPCDCAACNRPTTEARCVNVSLAQAQAANLLQDSGAAVGESAESDSVSFAGPVLFEELLKRTQLD
ncbi:MAG: dockerin type I domain-containing protein [Pirellulaceae bacterium]|nr:dockerin type I domain-containing protein [Pirellulaceae bacterium]